MFNLEAQEKPDALSNFREGNYERAIEICLQELEAEPRNMDSYTVLGWSYIALGDYQKAIEYSNKALSISRFDNRIIHILGEAHYKLGNNLEALKYLEEYVSIAPEGIHVDEVYYFMGEIFIRLEEYNNADIAISTAVYHEPNISYWWSRLGYAREQAEDFEYALLAYDRALDLNPRLEEALEGKQRIEQRISG